MSRKTALLALTTLALFGLGGTAAGVAWHLRNRPPAAALQEPHLPIESAAAPRPLPPLDAPALEQDPQLREQFRQAYRVALAEEAPPEMLKLLADATPPEPLPAPAELGEPPAPEETASSPEPPAFPSRHDRVVPASPFIGTYSVQIDERKSVLLPPAVMGQLGHPETVLVTLDDDGCLGLVALPQFDRLVTRTAQAAGNAREARRAQRLLCARTEWAAFDPVGYLVLPPAMADRVRLCGPAVVVGVGDRFELWDAGRWREYSRHNPKPAVGWHRPDDAN
jgi:MraZ protein